MPIVNHRCTSRNVASLPRGGLCERPRRHNPRTNEKSPSTNGCLQSRHPWYSSVLSLLRPDHGSAPCPRLSERGLACGGGAESTGPTLLGTCGRCSGLAKWSLQPRANHGVPSSPSTVFYPTQASHSLNTGKGGAFLACRFVADLSLSHAATLFLCISRTQLSLQYRHQGPCFADAKKSSSTLYCQLRRLLSVRHGLASPRLAPLNHHLRSRFTSSRPYHHLSHHLPYSSHSRSLPWGAPAAAFTTLLLDRRPCRLVPAAKERMISAPAASTTTTTISPSLEHAFDTVAGIELT